MSYRMDSSYFLESTLVKCLDGNNRTMKELKEAFDSNKSLWVYSYDIKANTVCPNEITSVLLEDVITDLVRVVLDDEFAVEVDSNHKFLNRDGEYVNANDLSMDDSLMPMYWTYDNMFGDSSKYKPYEHITSPVDRYTHHLVAEYKYGNVPAGYHRHHVDNNPRNNNPDNLIVIDAKTHYHEHIIQHNKSEKMRKIISERNRDPEFVQKIKDSWTPERRKARGEMFSNLHKQGRIPDNSYKSGRTKLLNRAKKVLENVDDPTFLDFMETYAPGNRSKPTYRVYVLNKVLRYWNSVDDMFLEAAGIFNHKVSSIEFVHSAESLGLYSITMNKFCNLCIPTNKGGIFIHQ